MVCRFAKRKQFWLRTLTLNEHSRKKQGPIGLAISKSRLGHDIPSDQIGFQANDPTVRSQRFPFRSKLFERQQNLHELTNARASWVFESSGSFLCSLFCCVRPTNHEPSQRRPSIAGGAIIDPSLPPKSFEYRIWERQEMKHRMFVNGLPLEYRQLIAWLRTAAVSDIYPLLRIDGHGW